MPSEISRLRASRADSALRAGVAIGLIGGALWCALPVAFSSQRQAAVDALLTALRDRRQDVASTARQYVTDFAGDPLGIWIAAEAAAQQGDHKSAIEFYSALPSDAAQWEFQRELGLGQRYNAIGDLARTEHHLRRAVSLNPCHLEANNRLGHLLQICGRVWESRPHFLVQIQRGKCRGDELLGASLSERFFRLDERLERLGEDPGSSAFPVRLAEARRRIFDNRESDAEVLLRELVAINPQIGEVQGRLGRMIVDRGDFAEFLDWRNGLPDESRRHPEVLFAEGIEARRLGLVDGAVHCFLEVLKLSPNHLGTHTQIAGCLDQLGRSDVAKNFSQRGLLLSEIERNYGLMRTDVHTEMVYETVQLLGKLGRYWEAAGWCYVVMQFDDPPTWANRELKRWVAHIGRETPGQLRPWMFVGSEEFAPPRWPDRDGHLPSAADADRSSVAWKFSDDADRLGMQFEYFEGTDEPNRMNHIFNVMGGGLGAIDYDLDGWIDLYFAQARDWRNPEPQPEWIDRLYRNMARERFADVTAAAGLNETGFSHGVTTGDFDQDGFPDIYVGNLGPNTLYRNNGDGTFHDVTPAAGIAGDEWSTSSVFVDLTGDGLPDLYVLNYTGPDETRTTICRNSAGEERACTPDVLTSAHDVLYVNRGDGTFRDVSEAAGILSPDGRGLGIVAWDFSGDGRLDLLVANDTSANFLFVSQGVRDGIPWFAEEGLIRGIAVDEDGNALASMGVAASDANGDARMDLFITNFFGESNSLYVGQEGGFFTDMTRPFHLRDASFWMLGFGCQFADFDGDGWCDLVATNGHVDQVSARGDPDRMAPQLFHNRHGRQFAEIPTDKLGSFFQKTYLGRGLATLDWNRDGRTDFAVSHLHGPAALVTNHTPPGGAALTVRLAGRRGTRDPVGALLTAQIGAHRLHRFVTAGDGFLVSNERRVDFTWPGATLVDRLTVRWPGGREQTWDNLATGQEILLIEDRLEPILLRIAPTAGSVDEN